jgi:hypothetical protein
LGGGFTVRTFFNPNFAYSTGSPYPLQLVLGAEVFPFKNLGFGLMADGAWSASSAKFAGQTTTFTINNYRADVNAAYRFVFAPVYAPTLYLRAGFGLRDVNWPSTADVANTNRFFGEFGLTLSQPLVPRYLNLVLGGSYLPWANQGSAGQTAYGPSSAWGVEWLVGVGGDIAAGFAWQLQVDQERFFDTYTVPTNATMPDIYTDYTLLVRFHLD